MQMTMNPKFVLVAFLRPFPAKGILMTPQGCGRQSGNKLFGLALRWEQTMTDDVIAAARPSVAPSFLPVIHMYSVPFCRTDTNYRAVACSQKNDITHAAGPTQQDGG